MKKRNNHLLSIIYHQTRGFTLLEILIVTALLAAIAIIAFIIINPGTQIAKGQDARRKADLGQLRKVLEDWYNDNNRYPKPSEICYDNAGNSNLCKICGIKTSSPALKPYLENLPCDPQDPTQDYIYQVNNVNSPSSYRVYIKLGNSSDPDIATAGCKSGCGPPPYPYSYGVSSPNWGLESNQNYCDIIEPLFVKDQTGICNICGSRANCIKNNGLQAFYIDSQCSIKCVER